MLEVIMLSILQFVFWSLVIVWIIGAVLFFLVFMWNNPRKKDDFFFSFFVSMLWPVFLKFIFHDNHKKPAM